MSTLGLTGSCLLMPACCCVIFFCAAVGCAPEDRRSPETPSGSAVVGRVVSGGLPIEGARVRRQGEAASVTTDADGRFTLPIDFDAESPFNVTAWKEGFFIGGMLAKQLPLQIQLTALPTDDDEGYEWVDPTPDEMSTLSCGNCHEEIYREWKTDGHANSANNRHLLNLYEGTDWHGQPSGSRGLVDDYPEGIGVCNACHVPSAKIDELAIADMRDIQGVARLGVHCDFCHKVQDAAESNIGLTHGRFGLSLLRPEHGQAFFGPLEDVDRGDDVYSPLQSRSRFCASCHEGVVFGVHVYSTYSEWLASPARRSGQECQTCHMAPTGKMTNFAPGAGGIERDPRTLASHSFLQRGRAELLKSCLKLSTSVRRESDKLNVRVDIETRDVGHRVPTGFLDRQLLLVVDATSTSGDEPLRLLRGPRLPPAAGDLADRAGRMFAKQPADPDQAIVPFWKLEGDLVDTRLQPEMTTSTSFEFPFDATQIRVRLIHRRFWDQVAKQRQWPDNETLVHDQIYTVDD